MGGYLLDTHAAIWFFTGDAMLSPTVDRIIRDRTNRVCLSVISAWELTIKISIGKLRFPGNAAGFTRAAQINDIIIIPIETAHLTTLESLPLIHRDPAYLRYVDRLLVATAISEQMAFVSADRNIAQYNVPVIW